MIVLAIPYLEVDLDKRKVLQNCINSFSDYDKLIIWSNDTLTKAWNHLLRLGFGMGADYVVLSNDDVTLEKGSLADLCKPGIVECPLVNGGVKKIFHGHIFSIPKDVYEKVGEFDERFEVYWSDTDYCKRMVDAGIIVRTNPKVNVLHPVPARTIQFIKGNVGEIDHQKYIEKWGQESYDPAMGL